MTSALADNANPSLFLYMLSKEVAMLRYIISFAAGFATAKVVTKSNIDHFKKAALKSYVVVKDEFSHQKTAQEAKESA